MKCMRRFLFYLRLILGVAFILVEFVARGVASVVFAFVPGKRVVRFLASYIPFVKVQVNVMKKFRGYDPLSTKELIEKAGFNTEVHYVETQDGYILCMQRIMGASHGSAAATPTKQGRGAAAVLGPKPAVLLMHGFMMSSEAWVCGDRTTSLPLMLAEKGFDVWIGNNRGNKYSHKHVKLRFWDTKYWNFSIDDFARYDIPAMMNHILMVSGNTKLSYIGLSQGTAQAFAAFSMSPELRTKINIFIALAPATEVLGMYNPVADAFCRSRPEFIYLFLGSNKPLLSSAMFWRDVLPASVHARFIDACLLVLFGWTSTNIDDDKKPVYYSHLYSPSSVKNLVHWFQIIKSKKFCMFSDHLEPSNLISMPEYVTEMIDCPVAMFYGGRDNVPDMRNLLGKNKPRGTVYVQEEPLYEHLDFLWARTAPKCIYEKCIELVRQHSQPHGRESPSPRTSLF